MLEQGVVQELHIERASARGLVGNIYLGRIARVLPGMQSAFIEIGLERAAFLHIADIWEHRQNGHDKPADRADPARGPVAADPGDQGPDRHQGRAPVDADQPGRTTAGLPAAGLAYRHLAAHRGRGRARDAAREAAAAAAGRARRRLHHPHDGGNRQRARNAERHRVPDQAVARPDRKVALGSAAVAGLPGSEPGAAGAARHDDRGNVAHPGRFARDVPENAGIRRPVHAEHSRSHRALCRRSAAVRSARRRGRDPEGAGAPRRPEVGRLSDHRPDRGDDDDRRQHRRLRRRPQLRRHDLQDQSRGGAGDRAAAAPAQSRRHHHHRLHRHGERRPSRRRCSPNSTRRSSAIARG